MGKEGRSLQDRIRERQQGGFVGRQGQVIQYRENLAFPVADERRRFLFNIHGDAGVGKTFLTRQLRQIAAGAGALTGYVDETAEDVTSATYPSRGVFLPRSMPPLPPTWPTRPASTWPGSSAITAMRACCCPPPTS
jgi:hypothetical protein